MFAAGSLALFLAACLAIDIGPGRSWMSHRITGGRLLGLSIGLALLER